MKKHPRAGARKLPVFGDFAGGGRAQISTSSAGVTRLSVGQIRIGSW